MPPTAAPTAPGATASTDLVDVVHRDLDARSARGLRLALARVRDVRAPTLAPVRTIALGVDGGHVEYLVALGSQPWDPDLERATSAVVAVAQDLAAALTALHDRGLAHGAVTPPEVFVSPEGSAVLVGTGAAWVAAPGTGRGPQPSDDVAALADLVLASLDPAGDDVEAEALRSLMVSAQQLDPESRPTASELGESLRRLVPAAAVRAAAPEPPPLPASPPGSPSAAPQARVPSRRWRLKRPSSRWLLVVPVALLLARLVIGAVADPASRTVEPLVPEPTLSTAVMPALTASAAPSGEAPQSAVAGPPAAAATSTDWAAELQRLDVGRRSALTSGSAAGLSHWLDPLGPAFARDLAVLRARSVAGLTVSGGALRIVSIEAERESTASAVLRVVDRRDPVVVAAGGTVVAREPARGPVGWRVELTRSTGQVWRVVDAVETG